MRRKAKRIRSDPSPKPELLPPDPVLSPEQQRDVCNLLIRGASPFSACQQLELPYDLFLNTKSCDQAFAAQLQQVQQTLSENIAARLYQEALKGNLTAIQFWLKQLPPPLWLIQTTHAPDPTPWDHLSDDEFQQQSAHLTNPNSTHSDRESKLPCRLVSSTTVSQSASPET